jgi:hypothetical protein
MGILWLAWTYVWRTAVNLVTILVFLYVFSRLHVRLEVIVVAVGGMLYVVVRGVWMGLVMAIHASSKATHKQVIDIRSTIDPGWLSPEEIFEARDQASRAEVHIYVKTAITSLTLTLVGLFCFFQLMRML